MKVVSDVLIVNKYIEQTMKNRMYRLLFVRSKGQKDVFCYTINRFIEIGNLKRGDKIVLILNVYSCMGETPRYKVCEVILLD